MHSSFQGQTRISGMQLAYKCCWNAFNGIELVALFNLNCLIMQGQVITTIGFLKEAPNVYHHGFNLYHKNRLILVSIFLVLKLILYTGTILLIYVRKCSNLVHNLWVVANTF